MAGLSQMTWEVCLLCITLYVRCHLANLPVTETNGQTHSRVSVVLVEIVEYRLAKTLL